MNDNIIKQWQNYASEVYDVRNHLIKITTNTKYHDDTTPANRISNAAKNHFRQSEPAILMTGYNVRFIDKDEFISLVQSNY